MLRRSPATAAFAVLLFTATLFAIPPSAAQYLGGTVAIKAPSDGIMDTGGSGTSIGFVNRDKKAGNLTVLYASVTELEYGQKAGHAVAATVTRTGEHVLTLSFRDVSGKEQAAVFELGKDIVGSTLDLLKSKTGKPVECQNRKATDSYKGCSVIGGS